MSPLHKGDQMHIRAGLYAFAVAAGLTVLPVKVQAAQVPAIFFAVLDGGNELSGAGDLDSVGSATVMMTAVSGQLCFAILVRGTDTPTMAHIHSGLAGASGGIVVTLTQPNAGNPGHSSGCLTGIAAATINNIRNNPHKFYVNVHTTAKGGGALRGQLF